MKVTILGCGSSGGVPLITGEWGKCDPDNPKNRRTRASVHVAVEDIDIVIDTGPDFRQQLLAHPISKLDAVLYTHSHADHIFGLDDLRPILFKQGRATPIFADHATLRVLERTFGYALKPAASGPYQAFIEAHPFEAKPFTIKNVEIVPIKMDHTVMTSWGFRIHNFAYCTDFKRIEGQELEKLTNLDLLVIDCLMFEEHKTHLNFDEALSIIKSVQPKQAILTHMNHFMDYNAVLERCPEGVKPAYDGLMLEI
ncbi:MBL fold metallo-hydrolase [Candidatus Odyssella thessalonicensis]|uniref:MBL fold metallo-hydrolase n=1 Tax=Candidatus Odyssella thessalonicensis TaxID=84647 RepID=UPI000225AEA6|nr:MBL fold metallo-hydrolase [Candidatus Odyssella thessalonicensis]